MKHNDMEWQPIETAPKDGTDFLIDCPDVVSGVTIAFYDQSGTLVSVYDGIPYAYWVQKPTVWMPLPEPPKTT